MDGGWGEMNDSYFDLMLVGMNGGESMLNCIVWVLFV